MPRFRFSAGSLPSTTSLEDSRYAILSFSLAGTLPFPPAILPLVAALSRPLHEDLSEWESLSRPSGLASGGRTRATRQPDPERTDIGGCNPALRAADPRHAVAASSHRKDRGAGTRPGRPPLGRCAGLHRRDCVFCPLRPPRSLL